jgi:hypothetical protein
LTIIYALIECQFGRFTRIVGSSGLTRFVYTHVDLSKTGCSKNMEEIDPKKTEKFVKEVMMTQRRYGTDQKNQKSNRQSDIRECLEKFVVKELSDEDK